MRRISVLVASSTGDLHHQVFALRQELVQRRIERADRDREAVHRLEHADEIGALHRQQLLERRAAIFLVVGENHGLHVRHAIFSPKNMCSVRQRPMPSAPNARA